MPKSVWIRRRLAQLRTKGPPRPDQSPIRQPLSLSAKRAPGPFDRADHERFFEDPTIFSSKWGWALVFTAIAILAVSLYGASEALISAKTTPTFWNSVLPNVALGLAVSLSAAVLTSLLINWENITRNRSVRDLADDHLLRRFFGMLSRFQNKYEAEKRIEIIFRRPDGNAEQLPLYLIATQRLQYYTFLAGHPGEPVRFKFNRFTNAPGSLAAPDTQSRYIPDVLEYEWLYNSDETRLSKLLPDAASLNAIYEISHVRLNFDDYDIRVEPNEDRSEWTLRYNNDLYDASKLIHIEFEVNYPVELSGYDYFTVRYPTHVFHLHVDFSDVGQYVDLFCEDLLNFISVRRQPPRTQDCTVYVASSDWVLPHGSIFLARYLKGE